jgi:hypothetical protein
MLTLKLGVCFVGYQTLILSLKIYSCKGLRASEDITKILLDT